MSRAHVLLDVLSERRRQLMKWGEQNHPDGTSWDDWVFPRDLAKADTDAAMKAGECTWLDILREEVCEAFAEEDPAALRTELIQVAAVALSWIEAIDRREETQPTT